MCLGQPAPPDLYQKGNPVDDKSVTPDPWAAMAAELRRMADDFEKLIGQVAPGLVSLDIQPKGDVSHPPVAKQRAETIEAVDAVAHALFGEPGETKAMSNGTFHHKRYGRRGRITVDVYQALADPGAVDPDEEIARLRARLAELEAGQ
jgi:hypothetical protein